jgi:hypothetical protein
MTKVFKPKLWSAEDGAYDFLKQGSQIYTTWKIDVPVETVVTTRRTPSNPYIILIDQNVTKIILMLK